MLLKLKVVEKLVLRSHCFHFPDEHFVRECHRELNIFHHVK